jgi:hypothetical protein
MAILLFVTASEPQRKKGSGHYSTPQGLDKMFAAPLEQSSNSQKTLDIRLKMP